MTGLKRLLFSLATVKWIINFSALAQKFQRKTILMIRIYVGIRKRMYASRNDIFFKYIEQVNQIKLEITSIHLFIRMVLIRDS